MDAADEAKQSITDVWKKKKRSSVWQSTQPGEEEDSSIPQREGAERLSSTDAPHAAPVVGIAPAGGVDALSIEEELQMGKDLGAIFKEKQVHPIFIFGSKGSGKTSLIASLFKYIRSREEAHASIELAEELFPENDPRWVRRVSWSRDVFYRKVFNFLDRQAPPSTQEDQPFFIPIRVSPKDREGVYFAFLEGKGEWYQPDYSASVPFRKFKGFLHGVLQAFNGSATVIYVAPFVADSADEGPSDRRIRDGDVGLLGAIEEYTLVRKAQFHQDAHLFLMTKWDVYCDSIASEEFTDPTDEEVQDALRERYQLAWTKYVNLNVSSHVANKAYSTYCAGVMDGGTVAAPAAQDDLRVAFYPRKLWDLLYQSATGEVLYVDVQPRTPSLLERLILLLRK